jgi:hypothetical protein
VSNPSNRYWLDASVFIEAQNRTYPIGIVDSYWRWLAGQVEAGRIVCPKRVFQEIVEGHERQDDLAKWFQARRGDGLCIASDRSVQKQVGIISTHVFSVYRSHQAMRFSDGADPWIIAHAQVDDGTVVTQESSLRPNSHKVRIPDLCRHFNVRCIDGLQMMKDLNAKI